MAFAGHLGFWKPTDRAPLVNRAPFPWRSLGKDEIREIPDAWVEADLRLDLIRRARHTIDIVQYLQTDDEEVARPLLSALNDAASREESPVKVRFLACQAPTFKFDPNLKFKNVLLDRPTVTPIRVELLNTTYGFGLMDCVHQKLIIVDGKWAVTGGRAYGKDFLTWLDDGFFLKGQLALDAQASFNRTWAFVRSQRPRPANRHFELSGPSFSERYSPPEAMRLTPEQAGEKEALLAWADQEAAPSDGVARRARLIYHDYLQQLWMKRFPSGIDERLARLDDPILSALIERLERDGPDRPQDVLITSMSVIPHPRLQRALVSAASKGTRVKILTNSEASDAQFAPFAMNWAYSREFLVDLLRNGIRIFSFDTRPDRHPWTYLHKKVAIVDGAVIFGSHNFNLPSTLFNEEVAFEVEDPDFAASIRARLEKEFELTGTELSAARIRVEMTRPHEVLRAIQHWLGNIFLPSF